MIVVATVAIATGVAACVIVVGCVVGRVVIARTVVLGLYVACINRCVNLFARCIYATCKWIGVQTVVAGDGAKVARICKQGGLTVFGDLLAGDVVHGCN